jgi:hypothetical protein
LLGTYISAKQFWELPFCTLTFFTSGLYFTDDQLSAVTTVDVEPYRKPRVGEFPALPVVELLLEHPEGEFVTHELLDGNLEPLYPPEQPGSYVFTQVIYQPSTTSTCVDISFRSCLRCRGSAMLNVLFIVLRL